MTGTKPNTLSAEERKALDELKAGADVDVLMPIVASALGMFLDEHESICLARILQTNAFMLREGGMPVGRYDVETCAKIVARMCREYTEEFLNQHRARNFLDIPVDARYDYWLRKLQWVKDADEPLTYADQNTLRRLTGLLSSDNRLLGVKYLERHPDQGG